MNSANHLIHIIIIIISIVVLVRVKKKHKLHTIILSEKLPSKYQQSGRPIRRSLLHLYTRTVNVVVVGVLIQWMLYTHSTTAVAAAFYTDLLQSLCFVLVRTCKPFSTRRRSCNHRKSQSTPLRVCRTRHTRFELEIPTQYTNQYPNDNSLKHNNLYTHILIIMLCSNNIIFKSCKRHRSSFRTFVLHSHLDKSNNNKILCTRSTQIML